MDTIGDQQSYGLKSLEEEQLEVSARHSRSSPVAMFLALGIITNLLYKHSDSYEWLAYLIAASLVLLIRFLTFNVLFKFADISIPQKVKIALVLSAVHGSVHASTLLFFPQLGEIERALLSLVLAGFCLQATATGGDIRQYLCFSIPIMPTIAVMWTTGGTFTVQSVEATLLGVSIAMFYIQQIYIALSNDAKTSESYDSKTELSRLNDELQAAVQKSEVANRAKTRFLASASHDLRQPIHALSLFSAALTRHDLPEQTRELAGYINDSVSVLSAQLDALLDLSKLDAGIIRPSIETIALHEMLQRICREYSQQAQDKDLEFIASVETACMVDTDSLLLERVIRNLLNNAIRYTEKGHVAVQLKTSGSRVEILISDTGNGIHPDEHERIFDEFYQVTEQPETQGLGLGLSIVSRLTILLGIELGLESSVGQGTTISLKMDLVERDVRHDTDITLSSRHSLTGTRILVIDDDIAIRHAMKELLESYGADVRLADSQAQAMAHLQEVGFDILLTDLGLGIEDGLAVAQKILASQSSPPAVLLVTGDTHSDKLQRAHQSEFTLLHKPVNSDQLLSEIQRHLPARESN